MSEVNTESGGQEKGKHKKVRAKKTSTHIDMTPMVDLAFLLLTFFMLTTTFSKPKTMEIAMPDTKDTTKKTDANGMTVILSGDHKIYWYKGELKEETVLQTTDFGSDGIRKILLTENKTTIEKIEALDKKFVSNQDTAYKRQAIEIKGAKAAITVVIKTDDKAKYKDVIDIIDELNIHNVGKYALVDLAKLEMDKIQALK